MDPTLTTMVVGISGLALGALASYVRSGGRSSGRDATLARERGLGDSEVRQLEHLTRFAPRSTLGDLLISPFRYDRAAAAYVDDLRRQSQPASRYFAMIVELTRLRRRVHPPGNALRTLVSSRDLPEAADVELRRAGQDLPVQAFIWAVNDDHFDVRLDAGALLEGLKPGHSTLSFELIRPGQGIYTFQATVRGSWLVPKPVIRLEHTDAIARNNRREFLRQPTTTPIVVTPEGHTSPIGAILRDLSGGGLSFTVEEPLPAGSQVRIMLALADSDAPPRFLDATILRCESETDTGRLCAYGHWTQLDSDAREAIVRFVFALQRRRVRAARVANESGDPNERVLVLVPSSEP